MMKRKTHEKEEIKDNTGHKTTDNKDNTENKETQSSSETSKTPTNGETGATSGADKVIAEVRAVEEKLAEMQDKYIRLSAEFDNYRKRTLREKMDLSKYAEENLLLKIIPLMDDFERAKQHMDSDSDITAVKNGIDIIYTKFGEFLKQNGIKEIESLNGNFNVDLHEAVAKVHVEDKDKKGKVVDVVLKGYYLQDKVLRFSKVVVGE
ncbi:MAG: nucleotide exchange factor GrpE [Bacteroidales bacterium]|nr:nucleotide exchange factor GrpE [Bacteroidales bacterium]MBK7626568.1 nucleotide exchange factor GrpE [Bacteroidales bacterium]